MVRRDGQLLRPHGERAVASPTTTDDGRAFTGASEFTVKIDPANEGVKIRRRVNRNRSNMQRTDVYVDGQLIADAPWYVCDLAATPEIAFRDTDYEIPAAYTKGKRPHDDQAAARRRPARQQQQRVLLLDLLLRPHASSTTK